MIFIGICGASGSGKSTLAKALRNALGERCLILTQDCYYLNKNDLPDEERQNINYDDPVSFDHDELLSDIQDLTSGKPITRKGYDYKHHRRNDSNDLIMPPDVLILEGIHAFNDRRLLDMMYLKLYVDVDADICLLRRINRDILERGRFIEDITVQYENSVRPMFHQYIRHYSKEADFIVTNGLNPRVVDILAGYVADELHKGKQA